MDGKMEIDSSTIYSSTGNLRPKIFIVSSDQNLYLTLLNSFQCYLISSVSEISSSNFTENGNNLLVQATIFDQPTNKEGEILFVRKTFPTAFIVIYDPTAASLPFYRLKCFDAGVNMVAHDIDSIVATLLKAVILLPNEFGARNYTCPYCNLSGLTELEMWNHIPVYHVNCADEVKIDECPICHLKYRKPLQVHIHSHHGPRVHKKPRLSSVRPLLETGNSDAKPSITQLYCFALVVCRHPITGHFLLCQEFANQGFWLPGGAVDDNEIITSAAIRETMEEAGVAIELKGILGLEYNPCGLYSTTSSYDKYLVRLRVVFYAEPSSVYEHIDCIPKSSPDFESVGACWCSYDDIYRDVGSHGQPLKLRGNEPRQWVKYLQDGGTIYPLSLLREKQG